MKTKRIAHFFFALAYVVIFTAANAAEVRVMVSAGFFHAYSELVPVFERNSGHKVITIRGPSLGNSPEAIPNRLKAGEPADVVIMVGASIDDLARQGLVRAETKVDFARSQIGMVGACGESETGYRHRRCSDAHAARCEVGRVLR